MTESLSEPEKNDWRDVMSSIAVKAGQEAGGLPAQPVSGWDGAGLRWMWSDFNSQNQVEEVILRAYPDTLNAGIQAEIYAVARAYGHPLLWSVTTFSTYLRLEAFEEAGDELSKLQEELPRHLLQAWEKAHKVSPEMDRLHNEKKQRDVEMYEQLAHLRTDVDPALLDPNAPGPTIDPALLDPNAPGPTIDPALLDSNAPGPTIDPNLLDPEEPGPTVDPNQLDPAAPGPTLDPAELESGRLEPIGLAEPAGVGEPGTSDQDLPDPSLADPELW